MSAQCFGIEQKMKQQSRGIGISHASFCYLTNGAQLLFSTAFRFRFQMIFQTILAVDCTWPLNFLNLAIGNRLEIVDFLETKKTKGACLNQAPISALCFFISIFIFDFRFCLDMPNQNLKQNAKHEQPKQAQARTETMAATAATNAP